MKHVAEEFKSGMSDSLVITLPKVNTSIGMAHFEVIYQTPYKNAYVASLIKELFNREGEVQNSFNNIKFFSAFSALKNGSIKKLRFSRTLDNIEAIVEKFIELRIKDDDLKNLRTNPGKYFIINETNALLLSIKRAIDFILCLLCDELDYSIGNFLSKVQDLEKGASIGGFHFSKTDLFLFQVINTVFNASKHSLLFEDSYIDVSPGYDRFFAIKSVTKDEFDQRINPELAKSKYYFWEKDGSIQIQAVPHKNKELILLEYNISIPQAMIAFLDFSVRYTSHFASLLLGIQHSRGKG